MYPTFTGATAKSITSTRAVAGEYNRWLECAGTRPFRRRKHAAARCRLSADDDGLLRPSRRWGHDEGGRRGVAGGRDREGRGCRCRSPARRQKQAHRARGRSIYEELVAVTTSRCGCASAGSRDHQQTRIEANRQLRHHVDVGDGARREGGLRSESVKAASAWSSVPLTLNVTLAG